MTPDQKAAYDSVRAATHRGQLPRPSACARCGASARFGSDGRSLLHGHHADYAKPLEVEWLCPKCHRKETRLPLGERNGNAVLRNGLVLAARLLHAEGFAIQDIAEFYGMSRQGLSHSINGRTWIERDK